MEWKDIKSRYVGRLETLRQATPEQVLEVSSTASIAEIKLAYRRRMASIHPDRSDPFTKSTDTELAKLINAAYEKLLKDRNRQ